jgi:hypothetical protein
MVSRFSLRRFESSLQVTHAVLTINPCLPPPPLEGDETLTEVDDHFAARLGEGERLLSSGVSLGSPRKVEIGEKGADRRSCRGCGDGSCAFCVT